MIKDNLEIFEFYIPLLKDYMSDFESVIIQNIGVFRELPINIIEKLYQYGLCSDKTIYNHFRKISNKILK